MASVPPMAVPTTVASKVICLKSDYNNKFLRYRNDIDSQTYGLLEFAGDEVMDQCAHFEIEQSKTYDGLVHLKSRYNNKYFVRWSPIHNWISASSHNIDENQCNWSCTLFKPIYLSDDDGTQKMRLMHVQLGHYASLWKDEASFDSCLNAGSNETNEDSYDVFTVVNLFNIPKHVAFKGNNGRYLGAIQLRGSPHLQFSFDNHDDPRVAHEVFEAPDGTLSIKSSYFGKFWRLGVDDWIVADADDPCGSSKADAKFRLVVRDVNVVALINMSKTWFCKRYTSRDIESSLRAATENFDIFTPLEMFDLGA
ncbi:uncharacterized protein LOC110698591 [Chenopodium quinoa]|uniref:Agglutinin domain-containing protein n=1 Tax=Chenopodium quinoa TaxID=63459 RepID=A0A803LE41_CHEQI|nr:uncharacterized protein LOC110698591 [Chenopodium quinoa]